MKKNVGSLERKFRIGAGFAAAAAIPFVRGNWARALLGTVATSGIATGFARYCPINHVMGINHFSTEGSTLSFERESSSPMRQIRKANDRAFPRTFQDATDLH